MASIPSTVALPQPLTMLATTASWQLHRPAGMSANKTIRITLTDADHQVLKRMAERFGMTIGAVARNLLQGIPLPRCCSHRPALGDASLARELAAMRLQLLRAVRALALAGDRRATASGSPAVGLLRPHLATLALEREVQHCVAGLECLITALLTGAR